MSLRKSLPPKKEMQKRHQREVNIAQMKQVIESEEDHVYWSDCHATVILAIILDICDGNCDRALALALQSRVSFLSTETRTDNPCESLPNTVASQTTFGFYGHYLPYHQRKRDRSLHSYLLPSLQTTLDKIRKHPLVDHEIFVTALTFFYPGENFLRNISKASLTMFLRASCNRYDKAMATAHPFRYLSYDYLETSTFPFHSKRTPCPWLTDVNDNPVTLLPLTLTGNVRPSLTEYGLLDVTLSGLSAITPCVLTAYLSSPAACSVISYSLAASLGLPIYETVQSHAIHFRAEVHRHQTEVGETDIIIGFCPTSSSVLDINTIRVLVVDSFEFDLCLGRDWLTTHRQLISKITKFDEEGTRKVFNRETWAEPLPDLSFLTPAHHQLRVHEHHGRVFRTGNRIPRSQQPLSHDVIEWYRTCDSHTSYVNPNEILNLR